MVTRKTKSGKTMYGTVYQGEEAWSMDMNFVQDVEDGRSQAILDRKDKITFLNRPKRDALTGQQLDVQKKDLPERAAVGNAVSSQRLEIADRVHEIVEKATSLESDLRG